MQSPRAKEKRSEENGVEHRGHEQVCGDAPTESHIALISRINQVWLGSRPKDKRRFVGVSGKKEGGYATPFFPFSVCFRVRAKSGGSSKSNMNSNRSSNGNWNCDNPQFPIRAQFRRSSDRVHTQSSGQPLPHIFFNNAYRGNFGEKLRISS